AMTNPTPSIVGVGEPVSIPVTDLFITFWFTGHDLLFETLGDVNTAEHWLFRCYWSVEPGLSVDVREQIERDLWNTNENIRTKLKGDAQLAGNSTDLKIYKSTTGWQQIGGIVYR